MNEKNIKDIINNLGAFFDTNHIFVFLSSLFIIMLFCFGFILKRRKDKIASNKYSIYKSIYFGAVLLVIFSIMYVGLILYFPKYTKYPHVNKLLLLLLTLIIGTILYRVSILIAIFVRNFLSKALEKELDDIVFKWTSIAIKVVVSIAVFFIALRIYDINITTLVAGLGIGGIAVALAAQDTISNILGCAIIILDKPFVIGNRIKILEYDGIIEAIGIRSIRIRTFDGSLIIVPNKTVSNANIENVTSRTSIRQSEEINIEPTLDNKKLEELIDFIKQILKDNEKIKNDFSVFFDKRNAISITIRMVYYTDTLDYIEYMTIKENINYAIYDLLLSKNIKYAYPSSVVYVENK